MAEQILDDAANNASTFESLAWLDRKRIDQATNLATGVGSALTS